MICSGLIAANKDNIKPIKKPIVVFDLKKMLEYDAKSLRCPWMTLS